MSWLKKKKKDNATIETKAEVSKAEYKVVLVEKLGGTVREIKTLYVERWKDLEDDVVYLRNVQSKFLEIFPQQINDFKNYTPEEVNNLIKKYQKALEGEREVDTEKVNEKDIENELMKLKAKKRSFKYDANSSYLSFDEKSRPTFYYLREGSTFFAFKWDTDTKTIFVPSDNRKKSASIALRNKESKYSTKTMIEAATILALILSVVFFGAGGYFWFKAHQSSLETFNNYDASEIAKVQRASIDVATQCALVSVAVAKAGLDIFHSIEDELGQNQTIIQGIVPE